MAIFRDGAFGNTVDTTGWALPGTGDSSFLNPSNYSLLDTVVDGARANIGVVPPNTNPAVTGTVAGQSNTTKYLALGAAGLALFFFLKRK